MLCPRKSWAVLRRSAMPPKKSLRRTRPSVATASVFLCRRSMSTTFSITHSVVLRRCLKFAFWSNGGSECYAWLRWRPFISRNCRHCTTLASSSNIPYCIVLLTDIWTMFSVLIIIIAIIVFVLHYFWYYMFITATSSLIIPLVLTQGILNIFKYNSRTFCLF